jgi:putative alpha-1,2-mannosidase
MSAWYVFHALGFFPVAGQDLYMITTPMFDNVVMNIGNGKQLKIISKNKVQPIFILDQQS